jgi:hypothetical protein
MAGGISSESGRVNSDTLPLVEDSRHDASRHERRLQQVISQIEEALRGLRFGQVTITVQDGVVVQIDRLERTRLQRTVE